jgi:hypothetical protein
MTKQLSRLVFIIILSFSQHLMAQRKTQTTALGVSAIYNFQTESFGNGLRLAIPIGNHFTLVPQVSYFYPFNQVHELHEQVNLHYIPFRIRAFSPYIIGGVSANQWFNYAESPYKNASAFSILAEVGGGVTFRRKRLGIFVEQRYNPIWEEGSLHVGALLFFKKNKKRRGGKGNECPAYM